MFPFLSKTYELIGYATKKHLATRFYSNYMVVYKGNMNRVEFATLGSSSYDETTLLSPPRLDTKGCSVTKVIQLASRNQALSELEHMTNILQQESRAVWKGKLHISCTNYVTNIVVSKVNRSMPAAIISREPTPMRSYMKRGARIKNPLLTTILICCHQHICRKT